MRRGCLIAIVVLVVILALLALGLWGLWVATGRGAPIYQVVGWMFEDGGSYPDAAHWYAKAVRAKPRDAQLRLRYAQALWRARDAKASLREYAEAARLEPTWSYPLFQKAAVEIYLGEFREAKQTLDAVGKLVPRDAYVPYYRGRLSAAQGRDAEAVQAFRQAIDTDAKTPEAYAELGKLLAKRGSTGEAVRTYEEGAARGSAECAQQLTALGRTPPRVVSSPAPSSPALQQPPTGPSPTTSASATPSASASGSSAPPPGFAGMMAGIMAVYFVFWAFMMLLFMAAWVAQILAVYDCARRDFREPATRAVWCIVIILAQWIGALIYYIVIYRKNDPPIQQPH